MKGKKRLLGALMVIAALIIMQVPGTEADASTSASGFQMEGSTLARYRGTEKNVSVPDTVQVIGQGAFEDDTNIELVVLPNSVKRIEAYAFWGCENLDTVVLGKGLSEVGDYAFTNCTGLEQISIPSTATSIGREAFKDCVNLKDITIPPETVNIHESAFDGCAQLTIHYESGSAAEKYAKEFYERQKEMPGYEETPPPDSSDAVEGIVGTPTPEPVPEETSAPTQAPIEEGQVLGTTHVVGNRAVLFLNNAMLRVFGGGPEQETGGSAADVPAADSGDVGGVSGSDGNENGEGLTDADIPKYRIVDGSIVADQAYYRDAALGDMTLEDGISQIGEFSFARSSLTSIGLPQGLEHIGYGAFYHCSRLADVALPDSVMCVEPKAFEHSLWVDSFLAGGSPEDGEESAEAGDFLVTGGVLVAYRGDSKEVAVPEGVRVIAGEAFRGHTEMERVALPDSLLVIGEGAFEGCTGLGEIDLGKNVEEIKDRAFLGNGVSEISIPASVREIGLQAFGNTVLTYEGAEAEYTYEPSATRLANEAYRVYDGADSGEPGVTVEGLEGASATLEGAARSYVLTVEQPEDVGRMESAFRRALQSGIPEGMAIYSLTLTDESGIPLMKLGNRALDMEIPVPEGLQGRKLQVVTLDGNGQLEAVEAEKITLDGREALYFRLDQVSMIGIWRVEKEGDIQGIAPNGNVDVVMPIVTPTESPIPVPTVAPTESPIPVPTVAPTEAPTPVPTLAPTESPIPVPTATPTEVPESTGGNDNSGQQSNAYDYVLNTRTKLIHYPNCAEVREIAPHNYAESNGPIDSLKEQGYETCRDCFGNTTNSPTNSNANNFNIYNNKDQQITDDAYVLNLNTMKIHIPDCGYVVKIKRENYATSNETIASLEAQGYVRCKVCLKY